MNLSTISTEDKQKIHDELLENISQFGSVNSFLTLIEDIRKSDIHPLLLGTRKFSASTGFIKWNKIIFKDKLVVLSQMHNEQPEPLLPEKEEKYYKKRLNALKTLSPILFTIKPSHRDDGEGFECRIFDYEDEKPSNINYIFDILFFSKMHIIKSIINFS